MIKKNKNKIKQKKMIMNGKQRKKMNKNKIQKKK